MTTAEELALDSIVTQNDVEAAWTELVAERKARQQKQLSDEAMGLCDALNIAFYHEENRRNLYGQLSGDKNRAARLRRLWQRAADRWRRRNGYQPIYQGTRRDPPAIGNYDRDYADDMRYGQF